MIDFVVPGKAEPQGSKTKTRWGVREDNPRTMPWRGRIALVAHDYMVAKMLHVLADVPVAVTLEFVLPRPKTAPKSYTPAAIKKPDIDKLCSGDPRRHHPRRHRHRRSSDAPGGRQAHRRNRRGGARPNPSGGTRCPESETWPRR